MDNYINNMFKDIDPKIKLDQEQKEVILDESKNLIVIAGAGSGKTTIIAAKVKYLVDIKKVNPKKILIISLTNKAINELKQRINVDFNINCEICTFHKLAYNLLKKEDFRYKVNCDTKPIVYKLIKNNKKTTNILRILNKDKVIRKISKNKLNRLEYLTDITYECIKLIKVLDGNLNDTIIKNKMVLQYIEYFNKINNEYNKILEENFECDFEDLITKTIKLNNIESDYEYIIVDEYQDISLNRFKLLLKLSKGANAKTIVVGDDFQAIFSFAGSNIDLFLNYQQTMNARLLKITSTYRNSKELIDIAGNFVMQNKKLINKKLISNKEIKYPVKIIGYKNDFDNKFEKIIKEIISEYGSGKNILILGRYKNDVLKIKSRNFNIKNNKIIYLKQKIIQIDFMTIHSSKGLGYDNVILINFDDEYKGFPSKIENNIIKKTIFNMSKDIEEEQRLFYVALTRTKNRVYILTKIKKESSFIYDIYNNPNVYIDYKFKNNKMRKKT